MFPKNTYLLPQAPSPLHPPPPPDSVEILLHGHGDMFYGHCLGTNPPLLQGASVLHGDPTNASQIVKKDRHSKIYTSQGPRDRRVRLSIGIARKFFDLQEMLGFDKPSKTLEWLLTKSKAAIKELVQAKQSKSSSSPPSECQVLFSDVVPQLRGEDGKGKYVVGASNLAKESRTKARARARERTREKMCIKSLIEAKNPGSIPVQFRNNQIEFLQLFAGSGSENASSCGMKENSILHCNEDLIDESGGGSTRKQKSFLGFQQNFAVSRDMDSNYNIPSASVNENWSNLYPVLDQQKFINSASNI